MAIASSRGDKAMDDMATKGCVFRIKSCAFDLLSMEEDLINEDIDDVWWEIISRDLRLKSTFMYCDLSHVISSSCDEQKRNLTDLGSMLFHYIEKLGNAVKSKDITSAQICHSDVSLALQELMAALIPAH
ncbi:oxygen-evolving enhancer protein 3-2, chloroplastic-like [Phalaenopsis equestris]|uniref:oxygen-evolving enhancer protein 3-2, chloroplastic-like n=1 Tax=Phalaenopsis equestris TaxID=78828 RepID=UPI0009E3AB4C|nr:oxygen-evolving enhancer protein 3-2, chloroplastic-like [Phalaenopsis equestris]